MKDGMDAAGITVAITRADSSPGVDIVDPIEHRRCQIRTDCPVAPSPTPRDRFPFPVETAVAFTATSLRIAVTGHGYVYDGDGQRLDEFTREQTLEFPDGSYQLEFPGLIRVCLQFSNGFTLSVEDGDPLLTLDERSQVRVGCRSLHTRPATTVTTTDTPADIADAISTFGSAIKSTGPERSFPTYRGHPPALRVGRSAEIPSELTPPISDVAIEVPATLEQVLPVATLAYYLGVRVEIGDRARIVGDGIDNEFTGATGFERDVNRTLKQVFLLDCGVRTEGRYDVNLRLRSELASRLDLPFAELFDAAPVDRLQRYLEIPYAAIADLMPDWRVTAHLEAASESVETLPFLVDDLATVQVNDAVPAADGGRSRVSGSAVSNGAGTADRPCDPDSTTGQAMERVWLGDGVPVDGTKGIQAAYEHRIHRSPRDGPIEIAVVCNAAEMADEGIVVDEVYGSREELPFEVTLEQQLTVAELEQLLGRDFHFFHYIGHIDADGLRCQDGRLDPADLSTVGPEAFFLNACQSYRHGVDLVRNGAIGGIVTRNDVVNYGAVRIGRTVARLLNYGFPLRAALEIARGQSIMGGEYTLVGDGTLSVVQAPSGLPQLYHVRRLEDSYGLSIQGFGAQPGMGCMWIPFVPHNESHYLAARRTEEFELTHDELAEFLALEPAPVLIDEQLTWSNEWSLSDSEVIRS